VAVLKSRSGALIKTLRVLGAAGEGDERRRMLWRRTWPVKLALNVSGVPDQDIKEKFRCEEAGEPRQWL
jgi:hypothetical protein